MSEEVRANEVLARIMRGNQTFNVVLTAGIRGILLLAQHLHRMHKEKLLSGGEIESFEKFLKATGGRFDIINVPVTEGNASELDAFQNMLEERKIRYHILPDLNGNDRARLETAIQCIETEKQIHHQAQRKDRATPVFRCISVSPTLGAGGFFV